MILTIVSENKYEAVVEFMKRNPCVKHVIYRIDDNAKIIDLPRPMIFTSDPESETAFSCAAEVFQLAGLHVYAVHAES